MNVDAVDQSAKQVGLPETRRTQRQGEYFISKGSMILILRFDDQGLRTIQKRERYGLKGVMKLGPQVDLCSGQITGFATLTVKAPVTLLGGAIWLDGDRALDFPPSDPQGEVVQRSIASVPSGRHELRIEKSGFEPILRRFETSITQDSAEVAILPTDLRRVSTGERNFKPFGDRLK